MSKNKQSSAQDRQIWILIIGMIAILGLSIPLGMTVFDIRFDYTLTIVTLGGAILGMISGVLGSFAVLRQESLMGDALSHAALPGVAIAFLLFGRDLGVLLIGAGIAGWIGVLFINAVTDTTRIKQDTAMAMTLSALFALGIALLSYIQGRGDAAQAGLDKFIFGQAAAIGRDDVILISIVTLISFIVLFAFWKEFKLVTFNTEFASANGFRVRFLENLLSLLIVVAIVLGLQLAGVILMVGNLIAPGVAARQWTHKLEQMIVLAGVFGAFSGATGAIISALDVGLPTGPLIIVVASIVVVISLFFAPERGLIWQWFSQRDDRRRFSTTYILRDLYSHALQHDNLHEAMQESTLIRVRGDVARLGIKQLNSQNLITNNKGAWSLTDKGIQAAKDDAHNQALWKLYRRRGANLDLPIIPENREKQIADFLPLDALTKLENLLEGAS
jgi:manganese/zinc/iron transport system permease protein